MEKAYPIVSGRKMRYFSDLSGRGMLDRISMLKPTHIG